MNRKTKTQLQQTAALMFSSSILTVNGKTDFQFSKFCTINRALEPNIPVPEHATMMWINQNKFWIVLYSCCLVLYSCCLVLHSCCTRVVSCCVVLYLCCFVLHLCCLVLCRVVLVLPCVVSCCLVLCHVVTRVAS